MSIGLRAGTNNDAYLQVNGTDVLTALSSGRIGIGTATPQHTLEIGSVGSSGTSILVNGDARVTGIVSIGQGNISFDGTAGSITTPVLKVGVGGTVITTTSGGLVGIRTTNPLEPLHVANASLISGGGGVFRFTTSNSSSYVQSGTSLTSGSSAPIIFSNIYANSEWARFTSTGQFLIGSATTTGTASQPLQVTGGGYFSGSVGIGYTSPISKIHITHAGNYLGSEGGSHGISINSGTAGRTLWMGYDDTIDAGYFSAAKGGESRPIYLQTRNLSSSTTVFVGIGTTQGTGTAEQYLQVGGNAYIRGNLGIGITNPSSFGSNGSQLALSGYNAGGGTGYHQFLGVRNTYGSATNPNKFFRLNSAGTLEVVNSAYNAIILALTDAGDLQINGNVGSGGNTALSSMVGRLVFDQDYSDTARGPNKIQYYNDAGAFVCGVGVHVDTTAYYSGGSHRWYKSTSQTAFTEVMAIDSSGNLGIGIASPRSHLNLSKSSSAGTVAATPSIVLTNRNNTNATFVHSGIFADMYRDTADPSYAAGIWFQREPFATNLSSAGNIIFGTGSNVNINDFPTERARITSAGYFKASNNGAYRTGSCHEFYSTTNDFTFVLTNVNNSFNTVLQLSDIWPAASSSYSFFQGRSNVGTSADIEVNLRGDGAILSDIAATTPADYAEMFEWEDGNLNEEDRCGMTVVLVGNKIREAETGEDPIGVISGNPAIIADSAWNRWTGKYLKDEFNRYIWEDYEVEDEDGNVVVQQRRKLNPDYDPNQEYVSRENRPEWDCVGLMGKLRIRKGQVTGTRWIKMRDIDDTVEEWLVR